MLEFCTLAIKNAERSEKVFNHPVDSWSPEKWTNAITGELGEMCNWLKKLNRLEDKLYQPSKDSHLTRDDIIKEIGRKWQILFCISTFLLLA